MMFSGGMYGYNIKMMIKVRLLKLKVLRDNASSPARHIQTIVRRWDL